MLIPSWIFSLCFYSLDLSGESLFPFRPVPKDLYPLKDGVPRVLSSCIFFLGEFIYSLASITIYCILIFTKSTLQSQTVYAENQTYIIIAYYILSVGCLVDTIGPADHPHSWLATSLLLLRELHYCLLNHPSQIPLLFPLLSLGLFHFVS